MEHPFPFLRRQIDRALEAGDIAEAKVILAAMKVHLAQEKAELEALEFVQEARKSQTGEGVT